MKTRDAGLSALSLVLADTYTTIYHEAQVPTMFMSEPWWAVAGVSYVMAVDQQNHFTGQYYHSCRDAWLRVSAGNGDSLYL
jgi:hypothetical protein